MIIIHRIRTARCCVYRGEITLIDINGDTHEFISEYEKTPLKRAANYLLQEAIEKSKELGYDDFIIDSNVSDVLKLPENCVFANEVEGLKDAATRW